MSRPGVLMAITDGDKGPGALSLPAWAREIGRAGVDVVQVRQKGWPDRAVLEVSRILCREPERAATVLVNGRLDIALAAGADGAHLPADEVSIEALRRRFGSGPVIGRSTHRPDEVARALWEGADYCTFGPVYETPGKRPIGLDALSEAAATGLPVLALGGVFPDRFEEVAERGAAGVAGIRMFRDTESLRDVVSAARRAFGGPS